MTTVSFPKSLINFVCFTDIDECSPNPCEHGGQCVQTLNASYVCGCAAGYTGVNCSDGKNFFFTVYQHTILLPTTLCTTTTIGHFSVPKSLSCENEVFLHDNKKSFLYQWLNT